MSSPASEGPCDRSRVLIRDLALTADGDVARGLLALQRAAYACEAALIGDDRIPPLHEGLEDLVQAPLLWIGAFAGDTVVGALAYLDAGDHLDIDRLVVDPGAHRRGVGSALVREVLRRAGSRRVLVSTGRDNHPARSLYERWGFSRAGEEEVLPGLRVTRYEHHAAR